MTTPVTHPEIERLRLRCADLRHRLRGVVEEWDRLVTVERPRLTTVYTHMFGELERERQRLALQSAELFRRVELLSIKATRGETITAEIVELINMVVDKEYARLRQRLREAFDMDSSQREREAQQQRDTVADHELTTMYRTLAKRLHPDKIGESEEQLAVWHRVQQAYQSRDGGRLRTLLTVVGANEHQAGFTDAWDMERWEREERELSTKFRMERRKLDSMLSEEPFSIASELDNPAWIDRHRQDLEADIRATRAAIVEHKQHYADLTEGIVLPDEAATMGRTDPSFEQEFMENTYFNGR